MFYAQLKPYHDKLGHTGALEHKGGWGMTPFVAPGQHGGMTAGAGFAATF